VTARVLVAGVGNVFLGDDAFGVEVARRLSAGPLPAGVEVADYGIRGLHLALRLLDAPDLLVVADATPRGGPPGTLYVIEPDVEAGARPPADGHGMDVPAVLAAVRAMGGALPRVRIVGCEPATVEERMGLSPPVAAAIDPAVKLLRSILERELATAAAPAAEEAAP
jgi:hydrogenase maturation protease